MAVVVYLECVLEVLPDSQKGVRSGGQGAAGKETKDNTS